MIDTIAFRLDAYLREPFCDFVRPPYHWAVSRQGPAFKNGFALTCKPTGLRLTGRDHVVTGAQVCLPRLLWGHNGRLIQSSEQFNQAIAWLNFTLWSVMTPRQNSLGLIPGSPDVSPERYFTRIDPVWHFPTSLGVREALRRAHHPRIRPHPSIYRGETITHEGSLLKIMAYDKVEQMKRQRETFIPESGIDRLEISVKAEAIKKYYQDQSGRGLFWLDFAWCQHLLRDVLGECDAFTIDTRDLGDSIYDYLAESEQLFPQESHTERYIKRTTKNKESAAKIRTKVRDAKSKCRYLFSLADLFPESEPWSIPPEIELPEFEQGHYKWCQEHAAYLQELLNLRSRGSQATNVAQPSSQPGFSAHMAEPAQAQARRAGPLGRE